MIDDCVQKSPWGIFALFTLGCFAFDGAYKLARGIANYRQTSFLGLKPLLNHKQQPVSKQEAKREILLSVAETTVAVGLFAIGAIHFLKSTPEKYFDQCRTPIIPTTLKSDKKIAECSLKFL